MGATVFVLLSLLLMGMDSVKQKCVTKNKVQKKGNKNRKKMSVKSESENSIGNRNKVVIKFTAFL